MIVPMGKKVKGTEKTTKRKLEFQAVSIFSLKEEIGSVTIKKHYDVLLTESHEFFTGFGCCIGQLSGGKLFFERGAVRKPAARKLLENRGAL